MKKVYDYVVIGGGSGGIASARRAALLGKKVALVEQSRLGGTCVNVGCIPKKLMFNAANFLSELDIMNSGYGFNLPASSSLPFDFQTLKRNRDAAVERLNGIYQRNLENSKVELVTGTARFLDNHTLAVGEGGDTYQAEHILIATGSSPMKYKFPGAELTLNSDDFFDLEKIPKSAVVLGGGYIGTELA